MEQWKWIVLNSIFSNNKKNIRRAVKIVKSLTCAEHSRLVIWSFGTGVEWKRARETESENASQFKCREANAARDRERFWMISCREYVIFDSTMTGTCQLIFFECLNHHQRSAANVNKQESQKFYASRVKCEILDQIVLNIGKNSISSSLKVNWIHWIWKHWILLLKTCNFHLKPTLPLKLHSFSSETRIRIRIEICAWVHIMNRTHTRVDRQDWLIRLSNCVEGWMDFVITTVQFSSFRHRMMRQMKLNASECARCCCLPNPFHTYQSCVCLSHSIPTNENPIHVLSQWGDVVCSGNNNGKTTAFHSCAQQYEGWIILLTLGSLFRLSN